MYTDYRTGRIQRRYRELANAAGLVATTHPPDEALWKQATEAVDAELRTEAAEISSTVWAGALAEEASELLANVAAGRAVDVTAAGNLSNRYTLARMALYRAKLNETGQDVCRVCSRLKPADEVKLTLIYTVTVAHRHNFDVLSHLQEFAYACELCRTERAPEPVMLRQENGDPIEGHVFVKVYDAVDVNGMFWVQVKNEGTHDDFDRAADGYNSQPLSGKTGPPSVLDDVARTLGVPPDLRVVNTGADARVVIQMRGYVLDLLPNEASRAALTVRSRPTAE